MAPKRKNDTAQSDVHQKKKKVANDEENVDEESHHETSKNYIESKLFKSSFSEGGSFKLSAAFNEDEEDEEEEEMYEQLSEQQQEQQQSESTMIDRTSSHNIRICKDPSSLPTPNWNLSSKYNKKQSFLFPLLPLQTAKVIVEKQVKDNSYKNIFQDVSVTSIIQNNFRDFGMYGQTFFRKNNSEALRKPAHEQVSISRANRLRLLIQNIEGKHKSKNKH
ncbi:predicted protein [Naegleria gruberi]|uniref:Predicted protein n=1 Tax=Naegleria gruberi TaxID=5762 RepID=D2VVI0_NAEGR|nr:uncharacterized protein NAEGRDRAFT_73026 [Naegleria gruberi]EFC39038.1 predicted protein [Naegleria gruberi]|eukprot:XP_002671782.1 predicted protein [Naegleria gruberi strain NEG-M]